MYRRREILSYHSMRCYCKSSSLLDYFLALRTASWTFLSHFRENVMLKFFLMPDKNGLYLKIKLTTSKFKRIKRNDAGGLLKRNYITYIIFFYFFWLKTKHFKGYYGLHERFIPVSQGLKLVFSR